MIPVFFNNNTNNVFHPPTAGYSIPYRPVTPGAAATRYVKISKVNNFMGEVNRSRVSTLITGGSVVEGSVSGM